MRPLRLLALLGFLVLPAQGCALWRDDRVFTTPSPWFNPAPAGAFDDPAAITRVPDAAIRAAKASAADDAARLLDAAPCVPLDDAQADALVGDGPLARAAPDTRPYLVRAVALSHTQGGFWARRLPGDALLVSFSCMGGCPLPMTDRPVVIWLDWRPARVYHSVHMAE